MNVYGEYNYQDPDRGYGFAGWTGRFVSADNQQQAIKKLNIKHGFVGVREMTQDEAIQVADDIRKQYNQLIKIETALLTATFNR